MAGPRARLGTYFTQASPSQGETTAVTDPCIHVTPHFSSMPENRPSNLTVLHIAKSTLSPKPGPIKTQRRRSESSQPETLTKARFRLLPPFAGKAPKRGPVWGVMCERF